MRNTRNWIGFKCVKDRMNKEKDEHNRTVPLCCLYFIIMVFTGIGYIYIAEDVERIENFIQQILPQIHLYSFFWLLAVIDIIVGTVYLIFTGIAFNERKIQFLRLLVFLFFGIIISIITSFVWAVITFIY